MTCSHCVIGFTGTLLVSKVTLDIICETAFGYKADSLHDPHNELAEAYELLLSLQSGTYTALMPLFLINVSKDQILLG